MHHFALYPKRKYINDLKINYNINRESHISLSWFSHGSSILVELEFLECWFCGGRKTREPGKKPSEKGENQQQTQPTYDTGPELNPGQIGGRRALSPLRQLCSLFRTSKTFKLGKMSLEHVPSSCPLVFADLKNLNYLSSRFLSRLDHELK